MIRIGLFLMLLVIGAGCSVPRTCEFGHWCDDNPCKVCRTEGELAETSEDCWNVECEDVCIPAVRFPWTHCDEVRCGRVRTVHVLEAGERDDRACEYDWQVETICPECREQNEDEDDAGSAEVSELPPAPAP